MCTRSSDILTWSLTDLATAIENKKVSPVEVTKLLIEQISIKNKKLNSYITVMEECAINDAIEAEKAILQGNYKGKLHGIPIAIKDNVFVKGIKNTSASEIYKDLVPEEDSELIRKLKSAGATIIGKTNMHEFAVSGTGDRSYFGPTRNPHDITKIAGGSSSGSGAAVAANLAYGAIGSDTGGSIRIPSSCCGIVGMKPTFGSVSKYGTVPLSVSLDHFGPMTKTVKDNAMILNTLVGYDSKDPYSVYRKEEDFTEDIGKSAEGLTIGILSNFINENVQTEVLDSINETIKDLEQRGLKVKPVHVDYSDDLFTAFQIIVATESYATFEEDLRVHPDKIEEETRGRLSQGANILASDYFHALMMKHRVSERFKDIFKQIDILLTPTLCILPIEINQRELEVNGVKTSTRILGRLTIPFNMTGFPAVSVPGISKAGLPVGLQIIAEPYAEKKLYQFAAFIENLYF